MPQEHIEPERLQRFLLEKLPLSEGEHEHLSKCRECVVKMVEASAIEVKRKRANPDIYVEPRKSA